MKKPSSLKNRSWKAEWLPRSFSSPATMAESAHPHQARHLSVGLRERYHFPDLRFRSSDRYCSRTVTDPTVNCHVPLTTRLIKVPT